MRSLFPAPGSCRTCSLSSLGQRAARSVDKLPVCEEWAGKRPRWRMCEQSSNVRPPLDIGINGRAAIVTASIRSAKPTKRMQCLHCAAVASTRTCSVGWPIWAREARPLVFGSVLSARAARCVSTDASKRAYSNPSAARRRQLPLHRGALHAGIAQLVEQRQVPEKRVQVPLPAPCARCARDPLTKQKGGPT